jgi:hypothetical protein
MKKEGPTPDAPSCSLWGLCLCSDSWRADGSMMGSIWHPTTPFPTPLNSHARMGQRDFCPVKCMKVTLSDQQTQRPGTGS